VRAILEGNVLGWWEVGISGGLGEEVLFDFIDAAAGADLGRGVSKHDIQSGR